MFVVSYKILPQSNASVDSLAKLWLQCEFSKSVDLSAASKSEATVGSINTFSNNKS